MPRNVVKAYVQSVLDHNNPGQMILDVCAGPEPNYYAPLFPGKTYHRLDISQNKNATIDFVCDIYSPPADLLGRYDTVLCLESLEHLPRLFSAVQALRVLTRPGGLIIISTVYCWGIHRHPQDYWRVLPDGMTALLNDSGLQILEVKMEGTQSTTPGGAFASARRPLQDKASVFTGDVKCPFSG